MCPPAAASEIGGATLRLSPVPSAPSQARRFVAGRLREWHLEDREETAVLLISELVTNALLHARTDIVVSLNRNAGEVVLEVSDGSPQRPTVRHFSAHAGTGRGLHLVETLARSWGVRMQDGGKTIWVVLDAGGSEGAAPAAFDLDSVEAL